METFEFGGVLPEFDRHVCEILHNIFQHRLPLELLNQELFSDLFTKFGAARIFHACNTFLDSYPDIRGPRKLALCLLFFIPAQSHLIIGEKLHLKVVREQWDRASQESEAPDRAAIGKASIEDIMEIIEILQPGQLRVQVIDDLVKREGFINLLAKAVLWKFRDRDGHLRYAIQTTAELCLQRQVLIRDYVIPDWLSSFYRLQLAWHDPAKEAKMLEFDLAPFAKEPEVPMQEFSSHIQLWQWFGEKLKLDQEALLKGDRDLRRGRGAHLVGCSWIRCPFFGEDLAAHVLQPILLCSGCQKAQYCSLECQKGYETTAALLA
ncbi:hypothetical protein FRC05_002866 [Tulasnella sp. 425]|nr:hypothetical protein FRC05_002866 [Tulasnella sp. 425]